MTHRLLFLGPPGAGKGTQAQRLSEQLQLLHLSTGDLLRAEIRAGSDLGRQVEAVMSKGELVSDALVLAIVGERLKTNDGGWLLDGFPRNLSQAEALDCLLKDLGQPLQRVLLMELDDETLVTRLLNRGRTDDTEEVIRHRLQVYRDQTAPLIQHYVDRGVLTRIPSQGTVEEVASAVKVALGGTA
jgi:adenylate kinase